MKIINLLVFILVLHGCRPKLIPNSGTFESFKTTLPPGYHLKNRVNSCNEAVEYMKSVIIKDSVNTNIFSDGKIFIPIATVAIKIVSEVNSKNLDDLQNFYIDLDCLRNLKLEALLEILLSDLQKENALNEINKKNKNKFIFDISIENIYCFNFIVNNGDVENMVWCKTENSHGN